MPLSVVEAMLCGRPCIVTDVAGNRELIRDNVNGFLAKAPTVELLDEAMNRAWENRHRLREMGEAAARTFANGCLPIQRAISSASSSPSLMARLARRAPSPLHAGIQARHAESPIGVLCRDLHLPHSLRRRGLRDLINRGELWPYGAHSSNSTFPLVSIRALPPKDEKTGDKLSTHSMVAVFADSSSCMIGTRLMHGVLVPQIFPLVSSMRLFPLSNSIS